MGNEREDFEQINDYVNRSLAISDESGETEERLFTTYMLSKLSEIEDPVIHGGFENVCNYENAFTGSKISSFYLDTYGEGDEYFGSLYVFISSYLHSDIPYVMRKDEVVGLFDKLDRFMNEAISNPKELMERLGEEDILYQLVYEIATNIDSYTKIHYVLLTNANIGKFTLKKYRFNNRDVEIIAYDISRFSEEIAGLSNSTILIDEALMGRRIPCSLTRIPAGNYDSYLCAFNGNELYRIFDKYQFRLLQSNVRSYLQLRGKTNKGISSTLKNTPQYFMAYNNGLSATASDVELDSNGNIISIDDFQIVNGGQTTASIYYAKEKNHCSLDDVWVTVKITVIKDKDNYSDIVKHISQYANTQNSVKFSDFSAMNAYNKEMYRLSQTVPSPKNGNDVLAARTYWYFENLTGTYENEAYKNGKAFKVKYPVKHKFNKTDMAAYDLSYQGFAAEACRGAQDAYKLYVDNLDKRELPTESDFKHLIAKKIIFDETYDLVSEIIGGQGKKHLAKYCIAYLASVATDKELDLDRIWKLQAMPETMKSDMEDLIRVLCPVLAKGAIEAQKSIEMYCRQLDTWNMIKQQYFATKHISSYIVQKDKIIDIVIPGYLSKDLGNLALMFDKDDFKDILDNLTKYVHEASFISFDTAKLQNYYINGLTDKIEIVYFLKIAYKMYRSGYKFKNPNFNDSFEEYEDELAKLARTKIRTIRDHSK